jgi:phage major head subunit gpT-like protein
VAEFEDGYALLVASMRSLTDDQGRIANTGNLGLVCMVDPTNERVARAVLEKGPVPGTTHATTSSGNTGVFQGNARVIVNPFLTNTAGDRMYLFVTAKPIKPIVYQTRIPWDFKLIVDGDDWEKHDMGALKGRSRFDYMLGDWKKGGRHVWT